MSELKTAQATAESVNREERMFGWGATKYGHIDAMIAKLEPYHALWTTTFEFFDKSNKWMMQPFKDVVAEEVEELVGEMYRKIYKLTKTFSGASGQPELEAPLKVALEVLFLCHAPSTLTHMHM
jgi:dynein heavy chain, axonemal